MQSNKKNDVSDPFTDSFRNSLAQVSVECEFLYFALNRLELLSSCEATKVVIPATPNAAHARSKKVGGEDASRAKEYGTEILENLKWVFNVLKVGIFDGPVFRFAEDHKAGIVGRIEREGLKSKELDSHTLQNGMDYSVPYFHYHLAKLVSHCTVVCCEVTRCIMATIENIERERDLTRSLSHLCMFYDFLRDNRRFVGSQSAFNSNKVYQLCASFEGIKLTPKETASSIRRSDGEEKERDRIETEVKAGKKIKQEAPESPTKAKKRKTIKNEEDASLETSLDRPKKKSKKNGKTKTKTEEDEEEEVAPFSRMGGSDEEEEEERETEVEEEEEEEGKRKSGPVVKKDLVASVEARKKKMEMAKTTKGKDEKKKTSATKKQSSTDDVHEAEVVSVLPSDHLIGDCPRYLVCWCGFPGKSAKEEEKIARIDRFVYKNNYLTKGTKTVHNDCSKRCNFLKLKFHVDYFLFKEEVDAGRIAKRGAGGDGEEEEENEGEETRHCAPKDDDPSSSDCAVFHCPCQGKMKFVFGKPGRNADDNTAKTFDQFPYTTGEQTRHLNQCKIMRNWKENVARVFWSMFIDDYENWKELEKSMRVPRPVKFTDSKKWACLFCAGGRFDRFDDLLLHLDLKDPKEEEDSNEEAGGDREEERIKKRHRVKPSKDCKVSLISNFNNTPVLSELFEMQFFEELKKTVDATIHKLFRNQFGDEEKIAKSGKKIPVEELENPKGSWFKALTWWFRVDMSSPAPPASLLSSPKGKKGGKKPSEEENAGKAGSTKPHPSWCHVRRLAQSKLTAFLAKTQEKWNIFQEEEGGFSYGKAVSKCVFVSSTPSAKLLPLCNVVPASAYRSANPTYSAKKSGSGGNGKKTQSEKSKIPSSRGREPSLEGSEDGDNSEEDPIEDDIEEAEDDRAEEEEEEDEPPKHQAARVSENAIPPKGKQEEKTKPAVKENKMDLSVRLSQIVPPISNKKKPEKKGTDPAALEEDDISEEEKVSKLEDRLARIKGNSSRSEEKETKKRESDEKTHKQNQQEEFSEFD